MTNLHWQQHPHDPNTLQAKHAAAMALATLALHGQVDALGAGLVSIVDEYPGDLPTIGSIGGAAWACYLVAASTDADPSAAVSRGLADLIQDADTDWAEVWRRACRKLLDAAQAQAQTQPPPPLDWSDGGDARDGAPPQYTKGFPRP